MLQRMISKDYLARAIRIVLVFALVFWSSFRAECLAFAAVNVDGQLAQHEENGDTLTNAEVWQVTDAGLEADDDSVLVVKAQDALGTAKGDKQARELRVNAHSAETGEGSLSFVVVPVWNEGDTATITYTAGEVEEGEDAPFEDQVFKNVKKGDPTPEFDGTPKRDGYEFDGWDPEVAETVTESATYTAKWKKGDKFTVTYTDGVGETIFQNQVYEVEAGADTPRFEGDYTREGYAFEGWAPELAETVTKDITYVAQWAESQKKTFTVTYLDSDGTQLESLQVEEGQPAPDWTPSREGFEFTGWSPSVTNSVTQDTTYTATWQVVAKPTYRITYYDYDGTALDAIDVEEGQSTPSWEPSRDGSTFAGWNPPLASTVTGDASYYAQWSTNFYTVSYYSEGAVVNTTEVAYGDPAPDYTPPSRDGYEFAGWDPPLASSVTNDVSYYAVWNETASVQSQADGASTRPAPAITTMAEHDVTIANFMNWEIEGPANISVDERGVAAVTGTSAGRATVRCYPNEDAAKLVDEGFEGANFEIVFDVQIVYVSSLEIYSVETGELVGGSVGDPVGSRESPLPLTKNEDGEFSYEFKAVANVADGLSDDETTKYESTPDKTLSQASDKLLGDLTWGVYDENGQEVAEDVATIDDGVLKVFAEDPVTLIVRCTTPDGENGDYSENVYVTTGESDEERIIYQGEDRHQDTLSVIVQSPKVKLETSNGQIGADEEESPESQTDLESGEAADPNYEEATATYDASLTNTETGKQLDINEKEYSMSLPVKRIANGETSTETQTVTASGRGTTLALLLDDAGVSLEDQKDIEYIEFGNVEAKSTRVMWSDLVNASHAEASYVMVAIQAYVHEPEKSASGSGQEPDEGSEESPSATTMAEDDEPGDDGVSEQAAPKNTWLDNTRFQIMFDESDAAPALSEAMPDLRWVNTITVHMKGAEEPEYVDGLRPSIAYDPVPKGVTALLTAVPPKSIGGANFGYKWERSTDEGKTWEEVSNNTQQTVHVPTDDEHLGNYYRVSVLIDDGDSRPSKAVQIQEGNGLVVQLDYIPPYAGDWANFTSHLIGADENDPSVQYRWEQSTDGCQTWQEIPDETGKTLRVRTNPISAADTAAEEGGDPVLTYIRVVAIIGSRSGVSGPQLLTVKVGDNPNGSDSQESDGNDTPQSETPSSSDDKIQEIEQYLNNPNNDEDEDGDNDEDDYAPTPAMSIVELDVNYGDDDEDYTDDEDDEQDLEEDEESPDDAEEDEPNAGVSDTPADMMKVIVDDEVSKKIHEQNRQQSEATPGARWTEISAVNASPDDVRRVLAGNPFAPLAVPTALGFTAAGLVEKLIAFRRQLS